MTQSTNRWQVHFGTKTTGAAINTWVRSGLWSTSANTRDDARSAAVGLSKFSPPAPIVSGQDGVYRVYDAKNDTYIASVVSTFTGIAAPAPAKKARKSRAKPKADPVQTPIAAATSKMVNHVVFVLDSSPSMGHHVANVSKVFDTLRATMAGVDIETLVSVYTFSDANKITRRTYNQPAAQIGSVSINVREGGSTALIDASMVAINDHVATQVAVSKKVDEDHSFLVYIITDGQENSSRQFSASDLRKRIGGLNDAWTVGILVPDSSGVHYAKMCGFEPGNIETWKVNSAKGFEELGFRLKDTYTNYAANRAVGVRSSSTLFQVQAANLTTEEIQRNLVEVTGGIYKADGTYQIRDFVEKMTNKPFAFGTAFYELEKRETIQPQKDIIIVSQKDGRKYGGAAARQLLGLRTTTSTSSRATSATGASSCSQPRSIAR